MHRIFSTVVSTGSALAIAALSLSAQSASAANYGNFTGNNFSFLNVSDINGLFGAPTVSANSLDFTPNSFEAECSASATCPPTPHTVTDTLTLQIQSDGSGFIGGINLNEAGDTTLSSFLNAFAATTVSADVFVDVLELNGTSINNLNLTTQMNFSSSGDFSTTTDGSGTHLWTGFLGLDIDQLIADAGLTGNATLVEVSLSNTLTAFAESGASARIEKKDIDGLAIKVIPEPGTSLLMGLGLAGLAYGGRRTGGRRAV